MEDHQPQTSKPEPAVSIPQGPVPQKNTTRNQLLIIGGLLLLVVCLCVGGCLALGGASFVAIIREKAPVEETLDSFMQAMMAEDTEKAFTLFSRRARKQMKTSDLEDMLAGNNYVLFEGYLRLEVGNLNISQAVNANPNEPQGTVANVDGTIYYDGGFTGTFQAILEKEDGAWRIHNINITVPPDKFTD